MKKKIIAILCAIIVLIPSIIAVCYYISLNGQAVNKNSVSSMTMTDISGVEYTFERNSNSLDLDNIASNMVEFFTEVSAKSSTNADLPEALNGTDYYKVTFVNYGREVEYKYYFNENPSFCYYIDNDNVCHQIPEKYAVAFLTSVYARSLFECATLPVLTNASGDIIKPTSMRWTYTAINDVYPTYEEKNAPDMANVYRMADSFHLSFSILADTINVVIKSGDSEVYTGPYDDISTMNIPGNTELTVEINAKWYKTDERASEGEATYNFKCMITDKAQFSMSQNADIVKNGDFVVLNAYNVIGDPSTIEFSSNPSLGIVPVFYRDDTCCRALLAIPYETAPGTYTITLKADGIEQDLPLEITEKRYSDGKEYIDSQLLSEGSFKDFDAAVSSILTTPSEKRYFDGGFVESIEGSSVKYGYGRTLTNSSEYTYSNYWVRLTASIGDTVVSMNAGKVVYVGEQTLTGNVVIVDHGLGLMSIYANLDKVNVQVGTLVGTGEALGTCGNTGYTNGSLQSVALTINGVYVSPYEIWDDEGIILEVPEK